MGVQNLLPFFVCKCWMQIKFHLGEVNIFIKGFMGMGGNDILFEC